MPYIKRTTRIGETVEVEHFYTAGKHNRSGSRQRRQKEPLGKHKKALAAFIALLGNWQSG